MRLLQGLGEIMYLNHLAHCRHVTRSDLEVVIRLGDTKRPSGELETYHLSGYYDQAK